MDTAPDPRAGSSVATVQGAHDQLGHFVLKRQVLSLVSRKFWIESPNGDKLLLATQEGFRLKERIYIGQPNAQPLFAILAREVFDFQGAYDVVDVVQNRRIGVLQRQGFASIVQDSWFLLDGHERPIGELKEDTLGMALLRRFFSNLIPQNYDLLVSGQRAADLRQNFNPFSYHLNVILEPHARQLIDTRLILASAVCLAAIEGRQEG